MRLRRTTVWACLLILLLGCGSSNWGTATGTASLDGEPLQKGTVSLEPVDGGAIAYATITANGSFRVMTGSKEGLQIGKYKVTVVDQTIPDMDSNEVVKLLTPAKYADSATSELEATIKPGRNTLEFHLKK